VQGVGGGIGASKTNPIVSFQKIWEYRVLDRRRRRRRRRGWGEREWKETGNCYVSRDSGSTRTHRPYILNPPPPMYYVCASFFFSFFPRPPTLFPFFMLSQSIDAECCICVLILSSYPACTWLYPSFSLLSPLLLPALYLCFSMLVRKGRIYIKFENRFVCALHTENKELASNSR